ncbi:hypothetical protein HPB48_020495 [Haemaphysalis longicornis]|uniref:Uncharacterized protein n=1 Tax=Haemaphysalis longicornis TaxID=44386 RepID=A0A9J6G0R7_HAELO|nr:hypothetical protein HPB48_020495 [Haemaphysalis longicornis]
MERGLQKPPLMKQPMMSFLPLKLFWQVKSFYSTDVGGSMREPLGSQLGQLLTTSGREAYCGTYFALVEPRTVVFQGADCKEHVPLHEVLRVILQHSTTEFNTFPKEDGYMCSAFEGHSFRNRPYLPGDTNKGCLQLYSDEIRVCNPMGSKRGKQSDSGLFFIAEFPCEIRLGSFRRSPCATC